MIECLYSDSLYLQFITLFSLFTVIAFPVMLMRKVEVKHTPTILNRFVIICAIWSICSFIGSTFLSGYMEEGSPQYIVRQVVFCIQSIAWIQLGIQAYRMGDLLVLPKKAYTFEGIRVIAVTAVISVNILFIIAPRAITSFTIGGYAPFAEQPIATSFACLFLIFDSPFLLGACFLLLKQSMNSHRSSFNTTNVHMAMVFSAVVSLAFFFDFIVPIFIGNRSGLTHNQYTRILFANA